jgi:sarcosine oxidase subunit beta
MGLGVEMLSQKDVRGIIPTIAKEWDFTGGKYCPADGTANPLLVVKAICRIARKKGLAIREHEPVIGMTVKTGKLTSVSTFDNKYHGGAFVIAAGPWTHKLCNLVGLDSPLMVHRDQILVTEPLQHHIDPFIIYGDMYLRQAIEGNVHLWGGHHPIKTFDKQLSYGAFAYAADRMTARFPYLKKVNIIRGFAGLTCYSPDEIPILDQIPNISNLFIAAGFSGHGFCLGPIVGKLIAEWIAEGKPSLDLSAFRWGRNYYSNDSEKKCF